jgi:hypothetical protein
MWSFVEPHPFENGARALNWAVTEISPSALLHLHSGLWVIGGQAREARLPGRFRFGICRPWELRLDHAASVPHQSFLDFLDRLLLHLRRWVGRPIERPTGHLRSECFVDAPFAVSGGHVVVALLAACGNDWRRAGFRLFAIGDPMPIEEWRRLARRLHDAISYDCDVCTALYFAQNATLVFDW